MEILLMLLYFRFSWPVHVVPRAEARAWVGIGPADSVARWRALGRVRARSGGGRLPQAGVAGASQRGAGAPGPRVPTRMARWDGSPGFWPWRVRGTDGWGTLTARAPGESRQTERSSWTGATRVGGSGEQRMLWQRRQLSAAREAGGSRPHGSAAACVRPKSGDQAARGSYPDTEGDTQRVGAWKPTCVTDG